LKSEQGKERQQKWRERATEGMGSRRLEEVEEEEEQMRSIPHVARVAVQGIGVEFDGFVIFTCHHLRVTFLDGCLARRRVLRKR